MLPLPRRCARTTLPMTVAVVACAHLYRSGKQCTAEHRRDTRAEEQACEGPSMWTVHAHRRCTEQSPRTLAGDQNKTQEDPLISCRTRETMQSVQSRTQHQQQRDDANSASQGNQAWPFACRYFLIKQSQANHCQHHTTTARLVAPAVLAFCFARFLAAITWELPDKTRR